MGHEPQPTAWAERAERELSAAGYRRGEARKAVLALLDAQACALSATEIGERLSDGERTVARASVYRILEQLEALRLVTRVEVGQGQARFEAARGEHHHHHLVCDSCGDVIPFEDPDLERSIHRLSRRIAFEVAEHDVVLHGACSDCREPRA